jgi:hypothetical protein
MNSEKYLQQAEKNYNHEICMLGSVWNGPGYHSRIPDGTWAHSTRESINYAIILLESGSRENSERALKIIAAIIGLQDRNPYRQTFGIWSWLYEEPLDRMAPPDWNWADFIGAALAHILKFHRQTMPEGLAGETATALANAAWAIFRRNVQPNYTNIAIMGAAVASTAGEMLAIPILQEYGRERLKRFLEYTREQGGLNEYNSPTYTFIALYEAERILQLVQEPLTRQYTEELRCLIWESIAAHFHPGTGQLAGPHSRAYHNHLAKNVATYLQETTGIKIYSHSDTGDDTETPDYIKHLPCPEHLRSRFLALPGEEIFLQEKFISKQPERKSFYGATWMVDNCCLGSCNYECFWTQRRPVLAYWKTSDDTAMVMRLRFLKDGKDFASAGLFNAQDRNRLLTGIKMFTDRGDFHIHLDRPTDNIFKASSMLLCYELRGRNAVAEQIDATRFVLRAGERQAVIHTIPGDFNGTPVVWRIVNEPDYARVEAVCHEGKQKDFNINAEFEVRLCAGLELLTRDESISTGSPVWSINGQTAEAKWLNLKLDYTVNSEKYD